MTTQEEREQAINRIAGILKSSASWTELADYIDEGERINGSDYIKIVELCKITAKLYKSIKRILQEADG